MPGAGHAARSRALTTQVAGEVIPSDARPAMVCASQPVWCWADGAVERATLCGAIAAPLPVRRCSVAWLCPRTHQLIIEPL
jgi:hypothetical protein